ncbi:MAG: bifunctional class I SAM-dependent methyltransferase/glycosyltransferase family 2 protein, partial [Acidobacteriota bacterium]|nr:bifunctional class I SAM-dependent methyltransferase/glycosyltransferase family 2 protein [Acidobacteriota bacterium]
ARNGYYHETVAGLCRAVVREGASVLELGCATGDLLAAMNPREGVGVDLSPRMIGLARRKHPRLYFIEGDAEQLPLARPFDYVLMSDLVGHLTDVQQTLSDLRRVCAPHTRVVVTSYNFLWQPALAVAERLGLKMPQPAQNWLGVGDLENLFRLTDFEIEQSFTRMLAPARVPLVGDWLNRLPERSRFFSNFGLLNLFVLRPAITNDARALAIAADAKAADGAPSGAARGEESRAVPRSHFVSVVVPCRNEAGNVAACVERVPPMGARTEIVFVDGDSTDGTVEEIEREIERWRGVKEIRLVHQIPRGVAKHNAASRAAPPADSAAARERPRAANLMLKLGKGDAVRKGFAAAAGDMLMILDADLTVPPEDLPKFYDAIASGKGELINGTRLVYPLADQSMKSLNFLGNKLFSWLFTWLLGQRIKDTLCGTKVVAREDYERIAAARAHFGDFDPFGDFDLLFGAARLKLKITEVPVRYQRRTAGESKVRVFRHGWLLARMSLIGFWRLKAQPWLARLRRRV